MKPKLKVAVEAAIRELQPDNPVYRAAEKPVFRQVEPEEPQEYVARRLDQIELTLSKLVQRLAGAQYAYAASPKEIGEGMTRVRFGGNVESLTKFEEIIPRGIRVIAIGLGGIVVDVPNSMTFNELLDLATRAGVEVSMVR